MDEIKETATENGDAATLNDLLERVVDRESFFAFVWALINDWNESIRREQIAPSSPYGPAANGWENGNIGQYLEAALAWSGGYPGVKSEMEAFPKEPSWRAFAEFVFAGKWYE